MSLDKFWAAHDWAALGRLGSWKVERRGDDVFLALPARDGDLYRVRFRCDGYPVSAPGVKFIDENGSENVLRAWPKGGGWVEQVVKPPPACFLCTDLTREGLQQHSEWKSRGTAWSQSKTLFNLIELITNLLRGEEYHGRAG